MPPTIADNWLRLLTEAQHARHHIGPFLQAGGLRNPILDTLVPSLLQVKAVGLLDDALKATIAQRGVKMPGKYDRTLGGRIAFLHDQGVIDGTEADIQRELRNNIGHEFEPRISREQFDGVATTIQTLLESLGYVGPRPDLKVLWDRIPHIPGRDGAVVSFDIAQRVVLDGLDVSRVVWHIDNLSPFSAAPE